jgi:hypothetical protein
VTSWILNDESLNSQQHREYFKIFLSKMEMSLFNVNDGYAEAIVRGYRSAFLTQEDYRRLSAADNLEGAFSPLVSDIFYRYPNGAR